MKIKKLIVNNILALCLMISALFIFSACGDSPVEEKKEPISEKGKIYTVANKQTDITIHWGDDKDEHMEEIGSEQNAINAFATFTISFDNDGKVVISAEGRSDDARFYVINEYNVLEFYNSAEDATNGIGKLDDDYYSAEYKFSADKKVITVKTTISEKSVVNKTSVVIKLTANE